MLRKISYFTAVIISLNYNSYAFTVHDAVISAHENNYGLRAQYEDLQIKKLAKPQALTGFLPTIVTQGGFNKTEVTSAASKSVLSANGSLNPNSAQYSLIITQPLYNGGGTLASIKAADNSVNSAYENFKDLSNKLSLQTIQAYEDLLKARNLHELNIKNEKAFLEHYKYAKIRFEHGEVTKTDVLLAESKYSQAIASREQSAGDVKSAEAALERLIGQAIPKKMEEIKVQDVTLPKNLDDFIVVSLKNNPSLLSAKYGATAANHQVNQAFSKLLPSVNAQAQFSKSDNPVNTTNPSSNTYSINVQVPIINNNGSDIISIRNSQYGAQQAKYAFQETERGVKQGAITAWSTYKTSAAIIKSQRDGVKAAQEALAGTMEEYKVGTKTTLDVLDAETNLFQNKVALRSAERDYVVAIFTILQLMGYIDAVDISDLNLEG